MYIIYRHWVSFMTCASTAGYIYLYSVYYFMTKTRYGEENSLFDIYILTHSYIYRMTGLFQTSFYFGYTAILSLGMFCMLGKMVITSIIYMLILLHL